MPIRCEQLNCCAYAAKCMTQFKVLLQRFYLRVRLEEYRQKLDFLLLMKDKIIRPCKLINARKFNVHRSTNLIERDKNLIQDEGQFVY